MSNNSNSNLFERAQELLEYWDGTMWARVIERDINENDLEALYYHCAQAEKERSIQDDDYYVN